MTGQGELGPSELAEWEFYAPISVGVHVYPGTPLQVRLHPETDRVVLAVAGRNHAEVNVFLDRPELIRLLEVVTAARHDLDAAVAALPDTEPDTEQATEYGNECGGGEPSAVTTAA